MALDAVNVNVYEAGDDVALAGVDNRRPTDVDGEPWFDRRYTTALDNERGTGEDAIRQDQIAPGKNEHPGDYPLLEAQSGKCKGLLSTLNLGLCTLSVSPPVDVEMQLSSFERKDYIDP